MSAQGFFRFAATDTASEAFRPKAISYVMAGGLVSAIIGPQLVSILTETNPDATAMRFFPVYIAVMIPERYWCAPVSVSRHPEGPPPHGGRGRGAAHAT